MAMPESETTYTAFPQDTHRISTGVHFTIPMIPDSVNTYNRHAKGKHFKSDRAKAFERDFPLFVRNQFVVGERFAVELRFVLGPRQCPDIDNLPKQVLDALARAGVLRNAKGEELTDNRFKRMTVEIDDTDRANPRTEISVWAIE